MNEERLNELWEAAVRDDWHIEDVRNLISAARRLAEVEAERDALKERLCKMIDGIETTLDPKQIKEITALKAENERLRDAIKQSMQERKTGYEVSADLILEDALSTPAPQADTNKGQDDERLQKPP